MLTKKIAQKIIEVKLIVVSKGRLQPVKQVANDRIRGFSRAELL